LILLVHTADQPIANFLHRSCQQPRLFYPKCSTLLASLATIPTVSETRMTDSDLEITQIPALRYQRLLYPRRNRPLTPSLSTPMFKMSSRDFMKSAELHYNRGNVDSSFTINSFQRCV
ncbi:hypothetical protein PMAYCL1PPCAC_32196, partial [Pristionchus mayeri]